MKQRIVFDAIYDRLEELEYADVTDCGGRPDSFVNMTDRYFNTNLENISINEKSRILVLIIFYFLRNGKEDYREVLFDALDEGTEYRASSDFINATKKSVMDILRKSPISVLLTAKSTNLGDSYSSLEIYQNNSLYQILDYGDIDEFIFEPYTFHKIDKISIGEKEEVEVNEQNMIWYEMMHESIRVDVDAEFYEKSVALYNEITIATFEKWLDKPDVKELMQSTELLGTTESKAVQNYLMGKSDYSMNILEIWRILEYPIVDIYEDALSFIDELIEPCIASDKKGREFVDERLLNKVFKIKYRREFREIELEVFKPVRDTFLALFEDVKLTTVFEGVTDETRLIRERLMSLTENDKCQYDNLLEYYLT